MIITQTVEIPTNRRLTIDIPPEVPAGKAQVEVKVIPFTKEETPQLKKKKTYNAIELDITEFKFHREEANARR